MTGQNPLSFVAKVFGSRATPVGAPIGYGQLDPQNALWMSTRHARDYSAGYLQALGMAANQAGAQLSAALATAYVGLCLSNPANSGKNLALLNVSGNVNVATGAPLAIGLITGFAAGGITVHTTPATVQPTYVGLANPLVGLVDAACTLVGTPIWSRWLAEVANAGVGSFSQDIQGGIIVPPGGYVAVGGTVAGPAAGFLGSFVWEEVAP